MKLRVPFMRRHFTLREFFTNRPGFWKSDFWVAGSLSPLVVNSFKGDKLMNTSKCPVCDWAINDGGIKVTVAGKEITVCCDECVEKAQANPAQYAAAQ